jgi:hypothetical protein
MAAENVDYIGLNIDESLQEKYDFKVYYKNQVSIQIESKIVNKLRNLDMVRFVTFVQDGIEGEKRQRYDIGLKNRNNKKMLELIKEFESETCLMKENRDEIIRMSSMKINENTNFKLASLYFLGYIQKDEVIEVLKLHYLNRECEEPDIIHKNVIYADSYYLDYVRQVDIPEMKELADIVEVLLRKGGGHLWMMGTDYAISGDKKYKIYIKGFQEVLFEEMNDYFSGDVKWGSLRNKIGLIKKWFLDHEEYFWEGIAFCIENGNLSLNFYFCFKNGNT